MTVVDQRMPTTRARPKRSIEERLAAGAALREKLHAGELRAGPTPEHLARALAEMLMTLGALFADLGEHEPRRAVRWKNVAKVLDEADHQLRRATIRR